jgi:putative nucleotidyltransferase with HDIG domain
VPTGDQQWRRRPAVAFLITVAVRLVPIAASFLSGLTLGHLTGRPSGSVLLWLWLGGLLVASTAVLVLVDRLARKALPLVALLRLAMVVPDKTPSRFKIAMGRPTGDGPGAEAAKLLRDVAELDSHDRRASGHSARVRAYVELLAEELQLPGRDRERLRWAALLHDVGKLQVPASTLARSGRLRPDDWQELHHHPTDGAKRIAPLRLWLGPWAATVVQHHERWDGSGYPGGLAGMQISRGARIVAVADAFETMTRPRAGEKALSAATAREELSRCAGSQFDPMIVKAFLRVSVGKLRWVMGPLTWLAEQPFLAGIQQAATQAGTAGARVGIGVATAGAVTAGVVAGVPAPITVDRPGVTATGEPASDAEGNGLIDVFMRQKERATTTSTPSPGR